MTMELMVPLPDQRSDVVVVGDDYIYHYRTDPYFKIAVWMNSDRVLESIMRHVEEEQGSNRDTIETITVRVPAGNQVRIYERDKVERG